MNARAWYPVEARLRGQSKREDIQKPTTIWLAAAVTLLALVGGTAAASSTTIYKSQIFNPAFSVVLQPGWTVAEWDVGPAQIYKNATTVPRSQEDGVVTWTWRRTAQAGVR